VEANLGIGRTRNSCTAAVFVGREIVRNIINLSCSTGFGDQGCEEGNELGARVPPGRMDNTRGRKG
jgi:hypothetical protein